MLGFFGYTIGEVLEWKLFTLNQYTCTSDISNDCYSSARNMFNTPIIFKEFEHFYWLTMTLWYVGVGCDMAI